MKKNKILKNKVLKKIIKKFLKYKFGKRIRKYGKSYKVRQKSINIIVIKKILESFINVNSYIYIYNKIIRKNRMPLFNVHILGQLLASALKKHTKLFNKLWRKTLRGFKRVKKLKGMKISYKGKVWGKGRTKSKKYSRGKMGLQTIKNLIDYSFIKTQNKYGVVGIKIWLNFNKERLYKNKNNIINKKNG